MTEQIQSQNNKKINTNNVIQQMEYNLKESPKQCINNQLLDNSSQSKQLQKFDKQPHQILGQERQVKDSLSYHKKKNLNTKCDKKDTIRIQQILKKQKLFEINSNHKTIKLSEKIIDARIKQIEQNRKQQLFLKQFRHKKAEQKLQKIQNRKILRKQMIKNSKIRIQNLKKSQYFYQELQNHWLKQKNEQQIKNKQIIQKKKDQMQFALKQIEYHCKKYQNIINDNNSTRQLKIEQRKLQLSEWQKKQNNYQFSLFMKTLSKQEQQKKQEQKKKRQQYSKFSKNKQSFTKKVRSQNRLKIVNSDKNIFTKQLQQNSHHQSLSRLQVIKQGNDNMKTLHCHIKQVDIQKDRIKLQKQMHKCGQIFQYPNYLTHQRIDNDCEKINPQMQNLEHILAKKYPWDDKLYEAKLVVDKMEEKTSLNNSKMIINSIKAKIKIIEQFSKQSYNFQQTVIIFEVIDMKIFDLYYLRQFSKNQI